MKLASHDLATQFVQQFAGQLSGQIVILSFHHPVHLNSVGPTRNQIMALRVAPNPQFEKCCAKRHIIKAVYQHSNLPTEKQILAFHFCASGKALTYGNMGKRDIYKTMANNQRCWQAKDRMLENVPV